MFVNTAAWYGDYEFDLDLPDNWRVAVWTPKTGRPLTDNEIRQRVIGQASIREACRGHSRPLIVVDDLNRPTPAWRIMPTLLEELADGGVHAERVRILMASGTHVSSTANALSKKVGPEAASLCRLIVHNSKTGCVRIGRTSFGTPVLVNREVLDSDFVIGVGGFYPSREVGFGGGSKLALGVLGFRSIANLHYRHQSTGWGSFDVRNNFRRDLDEIARMIGLRTTVSLLVDGQRQVIDCLCGDTYAYYATALESLKEMFRAPSPGRADIVISNSYPNDLSLTFVRAKGMVPLMHARPGASRIVIGACPEGLGFHGLFPFMNAPRHHRERMLAILLPMLLHRPGELTAKIRRRLVREARRRLDRDATATAALAASPPIWLYRTEADRSDPLPERVPGMRISSSWEEIAEGVSREQRHNARPTVSLYTCAPLQWI